MDHFRKAVSLQAVTPGRLPRRVAKQSMEWMSMVRSPDAKMSVTERQRLRIRLGNLEADAAYFQARLEILGEPVTANQLAQRRVFEVLRKGLEDLILKTKRRMLDEK